MKKSLEIKRMMALGILGGLVAALSMIKIPLGQFSITLALIPLVVGAILYGPKGGAFLGFEMGIVVLFVDAAVFYAISPIGTIIVVLLKSTMAGMVSGLVFNLLNKKAQVVGIITATVIAPIINTGIFLIGCLVFFYPTMVEWAAGEDVLGYMFVGLIGLNFVVEFAINVVLAPTVTYIIKVISKNYSIGSNLE